VQVVCGVQTVLFLSGQAPFAAPADAAAEAHADQLANVGRVFGDVGT